jgi:cell division protein FtsB
MYPVVFCYLPERKSMSGKAKAFLFILACILCVVAFIGFQCLREWLNYKSIDAVKAAELAELEKLTKENEAKRKELDESKTDAWVVRQAHELGMVLPGEIKIAEED